MSSTEQTPPPQPRIEPVAEPTAEQAEILEKTTLGDGPVANVFATMAHNPKLLKRFNVLGGYFMGQPQLPARWRELAILRTAHRTSCLYEFTQHRRIALEGSLLDESEIVRVVTDAANGWQEQERAIVEASDELCAAPCLSAAMWQRLDSFLDTPQLIELPLLVGFYRGLAGFINSVGIEVDATFEGAERSWPQERQTPDGW
jgi:4-carboxymuconolactone decarboxylase